MAGRNARRRVLRKARVETIRRGTFVADYVETKYNNIYAEAIQLYDLLDHIHPQKPDLKKAAEYRAWKSNVKKDLLKRAEEYNVWKSNNLQQAPQPVPSSPEPAEQSQDVYSDSSQAVSSSPEPAEQSQDVYSDSSQPVPSSPEPAEQSQDVYSDPSQPVPSSPEPAEQTQNGYNDNLQLRIPLINPTTIQQNPTVTTETLQIITEETLDSNVFEPSLVNQISNDTIDQIIQELRAETELQDIVKIIEEQIEFEELGMDLEIFEQDLLEKELQDY